jgi:hypothetical protein
MTELAATRAHHRHLEQARSQVIELLSRQSVERDLVSRSESAVPAGRQDVVAQLVARQHQAALEQRLSHFHPADIAFVLESLPPEARDLAWSLVRAERRGAVLLETSESVRRALVQAMPAEEIAALVPARARGRPGRRRAPARGASRVRVTLALPGAGPSRGRALTFLSLQVGPLLVAASGRPLLAPVRAGKGRPLPGEKQRLVTHGNPR